MKYITTIHTNRGDEYKIFVKISNERSEKYFIKWRKYLFGLIPYWCFIKTEYEITTNQPLDFSSPKQVISYIEKLEDAFHLIDKAVI